MSIVQKLAAIAANGSCPPLFKDPERPQLFRSKFEFGMARTEATARGTPAAERVSRPLAYGIRAFEATIPKVEAHPNYAKLVPGQQ